MHKRISSRAAPSSLLEPQQLEKGLLRDWAHALNLIAPDSADLHLQIKRFYDTASLVFAELDLGDPRTPPASLSYFQERKATKLAALLLQRIKSMLLIYIDEDPFSEGTERKRGAREFMATKKELGGRFSQLQRAPDNVRADFHFDRILDQFEIFLVIEVSNILAELPVTKTMGLPSAGELFNTLYESKLPYVMLPSRPELIGAVYADIFFQVVARTFQKAIDGLPLDAPKMPFDYDGIPNLFKDVARGRRPQLAGPRRRFGSKGPRG